MEESPREKASVEAARAARERALWAAEDGRAAYHRAERARDGLRQTEAKISETEARVAATLRRLAAAARADGRVTDAVRLERQADMAETGAEQARQQLHERLPGDSA